MNGITHIVVDGGHFDVPDLVAKRMMEYWNAMNATAKELEALKLTLTKLRAKQTEYFTNKAPDVLRACKAMERELDAYLAGKTTKQEPAQAALFK